MAGLTFNVLLEAVPRQATFALSVSVPGRNHFRLFRVSCG
jgi:hypothetical protein